MRTVAPGDLATAIKKKGGNIDAERMFLELHLQNKIDVNKTDKAKTKAATALGEKIWSPSHG